jgi:chitinase
MSRAVLALLAALALAAGGITSSGADFTASSSSPTTLTAAADFNTVAVSFTDPGATLKGTVSLDATASSNRGIASVRFQRAPEGGSDWFDVCVDTAAPYGCSWNTTSAADGSYDLRATAIDNAGYSHSAVRAARVVDNHALSVSLADPGAMSGSEALSASAANATGALQELTIQHRAAGATTWTTLCTGTTTPKSCNLDTTALPEGDRELRAVARDAAGHVAQTTPITRRVDNTPPTVTLSLPSTGSGTVTMTAGAGDGGSGIAYVAFEVLSNGSWFEFCRDTSSPYTCSSDSTTGSDGTYSIRAVTADNAGLRMVGAPQAIVIDNPPAGVEIAAANSGGTAGRLGSGDWLRLTWTEQIAPASVLSGWTGTSRAMRVRVKNNAATDELDFYSTTGTRLNLATELKLGANFVTTDAEFSATMVQSGAAITVTLGSRISGTLATAAAGTMTWRPSAAATDLSGKPSGTATVTEAGGSDVDF